MTIEKIDGIWAETGDKESTLTPTKKAAGWVGDDEPEIERFNYLTNRQDVAINDIIVERVNSYYDDATAPQSMISTGLWDESWGITSDTANLIDNGSGKSYFDMCVIFDSDNKPQLMVLDTTATKIEIYDARGGTLLDTSSLLTDDLSVGPTWTARTMCTDGTYVYVTFHESGSNTYCIQAWQISDWSVRTGWAATGTLLTGSGAGDNKRPIVIIASATKLAVSCSWITIAVSTSTAILILDITDGTIDDDGAGDAPTGTGAITTDGLCSDGTNIFFSVVEAGGDGYVCSATIADPAIGCGGTNYPMLNTNVVNMSLVSAGPNMICSASNIVGAGLATSDIVLKTHSTTDADLDTIIRGQDTMGTPLTGDDYVFEYAADICFDGVNVWILAHILINAIGQMVAIKIDASKLSLIDVTNSRQIFDVASGVFIIGADEEQAYSTASNNYQSIIFDGRDIWAIVEMAAGQTNSGKIFRIPLALLRC